jgi:hypothetical protein
MQVVLVTTAYGLLFHNYCRQQISLNDMVKSILLLSEWRSYLSLKGVPEKAFYPKQAVLA